MKDLMKNTMISIGMAVTIFCLTGVGFDIGYGGNFSLANYQFTKMVIGCMIVGIGFGVPTVVYRRDDLPMPVRVLVHMGIGCIVYTIVAIKYVKFPITNVTTKNIAKIIPATKN